MTGVLTPASGCERRVQTHYTRASRYTCGHGTSQEQTETAAKAKEHSTAGHAVQLSVLQSREVVRSEDGSDTKYRTDIVPSLPRRFPDVHQLFIRAGGRLQRLDRRLRSGQPLKRVSGHPHLWTNLLLQRQIHHHGHAELSIMF